MKERPMIKICGITRMQDAMACATLGADCLGFIFHEPSPRNADPAFVRSVCVKGPLKVGVFVRQRPDEILAVMERCHLHMAQLHGEYDEAECEAIGADRVLKVLWPNRFASTTDFIREAQRFAPHCRHLLLDAGTQGGGHGVSLDFSMLNNVTMTHSWFLAGGIGPKNALVAAALNPTGLDVNSAVESAPGIKDETKLRDFFSLLRNDQ